MEIVHYSSSFRRLRMLLWCGASIMAMFAVKEAQAGNPVRQVSTGKDGTNSGRWNDATAGKDGNDVTNTVSDSIENVTGTAIELGSRGGRGGNGDLNIVRPNKWGAKGGSAGAVSLRLSSQTISAGRDYQANNPLIWLYSTGGTGGNGFQRFSNGRGLGAGGASGDVTFQTVWDARNGANQTVIASLGNQAPGIYLLSQGGDAGGGDNARGGTYPDRMQAEAGGNAGAVRFTFGNADALASLGLGNDASASPWRITTTGDNSAAVILSSFGGNGGNSVYPGILIGNYSGTDGGNGGTVDGTNYGTLQTSGANSYGMLLQSVGGRGGNAGSAGTDGAAGGNAAAVTAINGGHISTEGAQALGIVAQSVGGPGGDGKRGNFVSGGNGGAAGTGGTVRVVQNSTGSIDTEGAGAAGILAQSVGGGYATDAYTMARNTASSGGGSGGGGGILPFNSGGEGGDGGTGGAVEVDYSGAIRTEGDGAEGIMAQSVGGGGGAGGRKLSVTPFLSVALGGGGGSGGAGGNVDFTGRKGSTVTTLGNAADAVMLQSVGGGGGVGGSVQTGTVGPVLSFTFAMGGDGGDGGNGGNITATSAASLATYGQDAYGLSAMSVGGGGGTAGDVSAVSVALPFPAANVRTPAISVTMALGGIGGNGGNGGTVKITNSGEISTDGANAAGINAISIGGGGGDGGAAWSYLAAAPYPDQKAVNFGVTLGGEGGGGGNGDAVTVSNTVSGVAGDTGLGIVQTAGFGATGIRAVSIGGGGGIGGDATSISNLVSKTGNYGVTIAVGGEGGTGGNGGKVDVSNSGSVITSGDFANAITAQSIGGGGGDGAAVDTQTKIGLNDPPGADGYAKSFVKILSLADGITGTIAVGGAGGGGGDGNSAKVTNTQSIETSGRNSVGIMALSVGGGGGGAGGYQGGGEGTMNAQLSVGGSGGGGGNGGAVTVENNKDATIATYGAGSAAIVAQSIGGGGGNGGGFSGKAANALSLKNKTDLMVQIAKELINTNAFLSAVAKAAQSAVNTVFPQKKVEDKAETLISTLRDLTQIVRKDKTVADKIGQSSYFIAMKALQLQYKDELKAINESSSPDKAKFPFSGTLSVSVGGSGGDGGVGEAVNVKNNGHILTAGDSLSPGIEAQSIGGGGGNGGGAFSDGTNTLNLTVSVGGSGGNGGNGGEVSIDNSGVIETFGVASPGILAQSIGGGGGIGGGATSTEKSISLSGNFNIGGSGGTSSQGGDVTIKNSGSITTHGNEGYGIFAQSIGGGGGYSVLSLQSASGESDTADGSSGTDADDATENLDQQASASIADLLNALDVDVQTPSTTGNVETNVVKASASFNFGSSGTAGGNGGNISVALNQGNIATSGENAIAILAQSIGGGGGAGGDVGASGSWWIPTISLSLGGAAMGGSGGNGGDVNVTLDGAQIKTGGISAAGVLAQSIGGGGGAASLVSGGGGPPSLGDETTASGLANIKIGGTGASSGNGGTVAVTLKKSEISTDGDLAPAIEAQSIGGGGGMADLIESSPIVAAPSSSTVMTVGVGGTGSSSGSGGAVNITLADSKITTGGFGAAGISAQSIGGGGGNASVSLDLPVESQLNGNIELALGGTAGRTNGNGGAVSVDLSGVTSVSTTGRSADAVFLQSIGGGGGQINVVTPPGSTLSDSSVIRRIQSATAAGNGGNITLKVSDNSTVRISASGEAANGIFAQSIGGGGGTFTGLNATRWNSDPGTTSENAQRTQKNGTGGNIFLSLGNATVTANGQDAYGVFLQSGVQGMDGTISAGTSTGSISLLTNGTITGGSGDGAAIRIDGGRDNKIEIGVNGVVDALSGNAIETRASQTDVDNRGLVIGNYETSSGTFNNLTSGTYRSLADGVISLGSSRFANQGTIDIGGTGQIGTLRVSGGVVDLGGKMLVDVSSSGTLPRNSDQLQADNLIVSGVRIVPHVVDGLLQDSFTVATADHMNIQSEARTASQIGPISWSVEEHPTSGGGGTLVLTSHADFVGSFRAPLLRTEHALLNSLQNAWSSRDGDMAPVFAGMANINSSQEYTQTIDSLTATENVGQTAVLQTLGASESLDASMGCPSFEGKSALVREGECLWMREGGAHVEQLSGGSADPFAASAVETRIGGQKQVSSNWFVGGTAAEKTNWLHAADGLTSSHGQSVDVALSARRQAGPLQLAAALHGGYGWFNVNNTFLTEDSMWKTANKTSTWTGGARFRAAYQFVFGDWYVMPRADFDIVYSAMPGYSLVDDQNLLRAHAMRQWTEVNQPEVEVGSRVRMGQRDWMRLWLTVGGNFIVGNGLSQKVTFSQRGKGGIDFISTAGIPSTMLNVGVGVQFLKKDRYEIMGTGKAQISDHFMTQQGTVRFAYHFF